MLDMKRTNQMPGTMKRMTAKERQAMMLRRAANHNVHVITPHGRVLAGRKGRKG